MLLTCHCRMSTHGDAATFTIEERSTHGNGSILNYRQFEMMHALTHLRA